MRPTGGAPHRDNPLSRRRSGVVRQGVDLRFVEGADTVRPWVSVSSRSAAGTVLDVGPAEAVEVAAAAGWPAVGLWFDPNTWIDATTRDVRQRLDDTGVVALDLEPVILGRGDDGGERRRRGSCAGRALRADGQRWGADRTCRRSSRRALRPRRDGGAELRIVLEFLPIFSIATLGQALEVVRRAERPEAAVLVDTLHLARSAGRRRSRGVAGDLLPYLQLADVPADTPVDLAGLRDEALHGRLLPGDGVLRLAAVLDRVTAVPVSVELRSRQLMEEFPDPVERARGARSDSTRRRLGGLNARDSRRDVSG